MFQGCGGTSAVHLNETVSEYAFEVVNGVAPKAALNAPKVDGPHDGAWYAVTIGFRVGIFPFWYVQRVFNLLYMVLIQL